MLVDKAGADQSETSDSTEQEDPSISTDVSLNPTNKENDSNSTVKADILKENDKEVNSPKPRQSIRHKKQSFTKEEDSFIVKGLKKYGKGKWTRILKDPEYKISQYQK